LTVKTDIGNGVSVVIFDNGSLQPPRVGDGVVFVEY
jgi:hypothetical protein